MNKYQYTVQGVDYDVEIVEVEGNVAKVNVNGISFEVEMKQPINPAKVMAKPKIEQPRPVAAPVVGEAPAAPAPVQAGSGTPIKSPLPGTITTVNVKVGDAVKTGDVVVTLEAMKMQNNIEAECDGTITSVAVKQGDSVMEGSVLVTIG